MSQNPAAWKFELQPQLPLLDGAPEGAHRHCPSPSEDDCEWHLDAHTREIGRRGIATARALLHSASGRAA